MDNTERMRRTAERVPGLMTIRRPISLPQPGAAEQGVVAGIGPEFDLGYIRQSPGATRPATSDDAAEADVALSDDGSGSDDTAAEAGVPIVVIPGGPGLASAIPYQGFRKRAAARGLDVIMIEHRGVGLSRRDLDGDDLPPEAMEVALVLDDVLAVLDAERVGRAVIVGSSYGTYIAQCFAATHPDRVAGLVLDSAMLDGVDRSVVTEHARDLLYHGTIGGPETRMLAAKIHDLVDAGEVDERQLGRNARVIYEFAGPEVLDAYLNQLRLGRASRTQALLEKSADTETDEGLPYYMEFDLVARINFREVDDVRGGDGRIFDSSWEFADLAADYDYVGGPCDLRAALSRFEFPVLVLSGERDLRTPRPTAEEIAGTAPGGVLVMLADQGHSALDTHESALLRGIDLVLDAVAAGFDASGAWSAAEAGRSLEREPDGFSGLKRTGGPSRHLGRVLTATLAVDRLLS